MSTQLSDSCLQGKSIDYLKVLLPLVIISTLIIIIIIEEGGETNRSLEVRLFLTSFTDVSSGMKHLCI